MLKDELEAYVPYNEQEEKDREEILRRLNSGEELYTRGNRSAHLTASGWVVSKDRKKILMCYHNLYDSWSWLGGHADGDKDLLETALREVKEESGIRTVVPLSTEIFSVEILTVDGHVKKGEYVSSHLHLNVTYLLEADETEELTAKADENKGVKWFEMDEAVRASNEPWFREHIYSKLNRKLKEYLWKI
ncbi:MAG: NUDIX hydrolase [Solobacterium sp.]|nr:NUDIX hydrolase [Solobacterium sp.]